MHFERLTHFDCCVLQRNLPLVCYGIKRFRCKGDFCIPTHLVISQYVFVGGEVCPVSTVLELVGLHPLWVVLSAPGYECVNRLDSL